MNAWFVKIGHFLQVPFKVFSFLVYCHVTSFKIFIGGGYVGMPSLITGNYDTFSIGQIPDAGILQTVELVRFREFQGCSDLIEIITVDTCRCFLLTWLEAFTEQVIMAGLGEYLQIEHGLDKNIVQTYHSVTAVL